MGKIFATTGLMAGGAALIFAAALLGILSCEMGVKGVLLVIAGIAVVCVPLNLLARVFKRIFNIGLGLFIAIGMLSSLLLSLLGLGYVNYLESIGYWEGEFLGGLGEYLFALAGIAGSVVFIVILLVVRWTTNLIRQIKPHEISEDAEQK